MISGPTNYSTLDPQTNERSWVTILNPCTRPAIFFCAYIDNKRFVAFGAFYNEVGIHCMLLRWVKWNSVRIFLANFLERRCSSVVTFPKTSEQVL